MAIAAGKIQDSELEVMRVLWAHGGSMALSDIRMALAHTRGWEASTVKTLLRRLQAKQAVTLQSRGVYSALVKEGEYNEQSTGAFIDKLFEGSARKLAVSLVASGQLDEQDIEELRQMFKVDKTDE